MRALLLSQDNMLKHSYNQSALNMTIYTNCCSAYLSYRSGRQLCSAGCRMTRATPAGEPSLLRKPNTDGLSIW